MPPPKRSQKQSISQSSQGVSNTLVFETNHLKPPNFQPSNPAIESPSGRSMGSYAICIHSLVTSLHPIAHPSSSSQDRPHDRYLNWSISSYPFFAGAHAWPVPNEPLKKTSDASEQKTNDPLRKSNMGNAGKSPSIPELNDFRLKIIELNGGFSIALTKGYHPTDPTLPSQRWSPAEVIASPFQSGRKIKNKGLRSNIGWSNKHKQILLGNME